MLDRRLIEDTAVRFDAPEGLIEKDWFVTRALGVLAAFDHGDITPVFGGGTSLSKGWGLIQRFSEDIDFKVVIPSSGSTAKDRANRSAYRDNVLTALQKDGFALVGDVLKRNESRFFSADLAYPSQFAAAPGLRPFVRVEMTFDAPALPGVSRPISSLVTQALNKPAEIAAFPCVDPTETAADKLSALAWRVCTRKRDSEKDDPTIIRHLHDLAALAPVVADEAAFKTLFLQVAAADANRGGGDAPSDVRARLALMLEKLETDKLWAKDYEDYVLLVSFAKPDARISFALAFSAVTRLVHRVSAA